MVRRCVERCPRSGGGALDDLCRRIRAPKRAICPWDSRLSGSLSKSMRHYNVHQARFGHDRKRTAPEMLYRKPISMFQDIELSPRSNQRKSSCTPCLRCHSRPSISLTHYPAHTSNSASQALYSASSLSLSFLYLSGSDSRSFHLRDECGYSAAQSRSL